MWYTWKLTKHYAYVVKLNIFKVVQGKNAMWLYIRIEDLLFLTSAGLINKLCLSLYFQNKRII